MEAHTFPQCAYCFDDVTKFRIKCAVCPNMVTLCFQCFSVGVEIGAHVKTHSYRIISYLVDKDKPPVPSEISLFKSHLKWKADEEFALIKAVQRWGIGNWPAIAKIMDTKSPEDIQDHFISYYLDGIIGQVTFPLQKIIEIPDHIEALSGSQDHSPTNRNVKQMCKDIPEEMCKDIDYMPKREFFSHHDHDEEVHSIVVEMTGDFDEKDVFYSVELACLDIYRHRARERYKVEEVVQEYNLIQQFCDSMATKTVKTNTNESTLRKKMRVFCQFLSCEDHEALIQGYLEEEKLRSTVVELKEQLAKKYSALNPTKNGSSNKADHSPSPRGKQSKSKDHKLKRASNSGSSSQSNSSKKKGNNASTAGGRGRKRPYNEEEAAVEEPPVILNIYSLLSAAERKICDSLDLKPSHYLTLKVVLIRDFGILNNRADPSQIKYRKSRTMQTILHFMCQNGWIRLD